MERVELTFYLHDDMPMTAPRAETAEGWLTLGLHEDLREAAYRALDDMLTLLTRHRLSRADALALPVWPWTCASPRSSTAFAASTPSCRTGQ